MLILPNILQKLNIYCAVKIEGFAVRLPEVLGSTCASTCHRQHRVNDKLVSPREVLSQSALDAKAFGSDEVRMTALRTMIISKAESNIRQHINSPSKTVAA